MTTKKLISLADKLRDAERKARWLEEENHELKYEIRTKVRSQDRVYFDEKGKLCFSHNCLGMIVDTHLPERWRISRTGEVTPSVECLRCGAHFNIKIQVSLHYMEGYRPWRRTFGTRPFNADREEYGWAQQRGH